MLDTRILDWAPAKDYPVTVRSLGRHGPFIVQTSTFGSATRDSWFDAPIDELPLVPAKTVSGKEDELAVPPAVKAWRLSHANAKIRKEAKISRFPSFNGEMGELHAARLPSNEPCEDELDARTADGLVYAGIYDGHGGSATAVTLRGSLIPFVSRELHRVGKDAAPDKVDDAIGSAFIKLDNAILGNAKAVLIRADPCDPAAMSALAPATAGSCALLSIFDRRSSTLRVACVGDSRAVLGFNKGDSGISAYEAKALSEDQNADNKQEVARIKAAHPDETDQDLFKWGRFLGIMVTRAFGDHRWKWAPELAEKVCQEFLGPQPKEGILSPPYLTAEPVVTCTSVSAKDFVILASDGFWDHVAAEHAVLLVEEWLAKKKERHDRKDQNDDGAANTMDGTLDLDFDEDGYAGWKTLPQHFAVEDLDNAALHLLKNALGGNRRNLFVAATMMGLPLARNMRDDIAVQVLFF